MPSRSVLDVPQLPCTAPGSERGWPLGRWLIAFVSLVVPFGTFLFDGSLRREIAEMTPSPQGLPRSD